MVYLHTILLEWIKDLFRLVRCNCCNKLILRLFALRNGDKYYHRKCWRQEFKTVDEVIHHVSKKDDIVLMTGKEHIIFGYLPLLSYFNTLSKEQFLKEIELYRVYECAEYLWNSWGFDFPLKYTDPNRPHCCKFCTYRHYRNKKCKFSKLYSEYYQKLSKL